MTRAGRVLGFLDSILWTSDVCVFLTCVLDVCHNVCVCVCVCVSRPGDKGKILNFDRLLMKCLPNSRKISSKDGCFKRIVPRKNVTEEEESF